jgi:hypothetical protein
MTLIHRPVLLSLPGLIAIDSYAPAELISAQFVERVATFIAQTTAVELTHTFRSDFPKKLDRPIADEADAAWSAVPQRRLRLSNKLSDPDHLQLSIGRSPRRTDEGRAFHGFVSIWLTPGSRAAELLAQNFASLVQLCGSDYARCDVASGGVSPPGIEAQGQLVIPFAKDWLVAERLGWITCFSKHAMFHVDAAARARLIEAGATLEALPDGRGLLSLPASPSEPVAAAFAARRSFADILARSFGTATGA